jgi:hypothetical protein
MTRLSLRHNPLGLLFSGDLWAAAWYLFGYLVVAWLLFAVALTIAVGGGLLSVTLAGIPMLIAAAAVIRWCADAERVRLRTVDPRPFGRPYREFTGSGLLARVRADWRDPAIWRDIAYLFGLMAPLLTLDFAVLTVWLGLLAGITSPAWYETVKNTCIGYCAGPGAQGIQFGDFPHGPHGPGASGWYVGTLPSALILAAICLVAFLLFSYVVIATARLHAVVARALLSPADDPLREAKEVLRRPGPLRTFIPNGPS